MMSIKQVDYFIRLFEQNFHLGKVALTGNLDEDEGFTNLIETNPWGITNKLVDITEQTNSYDNLLESANFLKLTKFDGYIGNHEFLKLIFELLLENGGTIIAKVEGDESINLLAYQDLHDKERIVGQKSTLALLGGSDFKPS
jgi:hypothetical protein